MNFNDSSNNLLTLLKASKLLGVTTKTIKRWEKTGYIQCTRTKGNHRRVSVSEINRLRDSAGLSNRGTIAYCRVSTAKQADNLDRQIGRVLAFCLENQWTPKLLKDIGSGLNDKRVGLKSLILEISKGDVARVVVEYSDRLTRFGINSFKQFLATYDTELIVISDNEDKEFEVELAEDMIAIITTYSARLYGRRGGRKKCEKSSKV
jgi:excisionase family DNA binding protein